MSFLFHKDVFMPASVKSPCYQGRLQYSDHALRESQSDRFGGMALPAFFDATNAELIESELADDRSTITKQVWRLHLDAERDLVLVITNKGRVKTVWINLRSDKHLTLRRERYMQA